jgi:hypothetical protein
MPVATEVIMKRRFDGSLYPKDFNESQRKYVGVAIPLFQTSDPDNEYVRIEYFLDDITLHNGTRIQDITDQDILMRHLENDDIYAFEADSEYIGNGTYTLTNIVIPRQIHGQY